MWKLFAFLCTIAPLAAQPVYPPSLPGATEHVYRSVDGINLKLWVFQPNEEVATSEARPAIVFFFGGGWKKGSPGQFESQCRYLASRGMVAVTADYRVAERHGVQANACVEDCKAAVRWLRQHSAVLRIDPDRVCAAGGSAGGHTACCTALIDGMDPTEGDRSVSSVPNALALFNPAVMLAPLSGFDVPQIDQDRWKDIAGRTGVPPEQISPIHHVRPDLPPTVIFHGTSDSAVPFATVKEFTRRMQAHGNRCELAAFANAPHGFFNAPRGNDARRRDLSGHWHQRTLLKLDHFLQSLGWLQGDAGVRTVDHDFIYFRGQLQNSLRKFGAEGVGHVAFLGGSITEMNGYRPLIQQWLQKRFPDTEFDFTNAGIASTGSTTGAFRVGRDVLSRGPVDLLLVEFAVNDDQDEQLAAIDCVRGMEGIVRQVRQHNPAADIVMVHFVNPPMLETLKAGQQIRSASQHEKVARHYALPSVYLPKIVAQKIESGELTWQQYGGTHPKQPGNQLAADSVTNILQAAWRGLDPMSLVEEHHPWPDQPLEPTSYDRGVLLDSESVALEPGWDFSIPDWSKLTGGKRQRFLDRRLLYSVTPGATAEFCFRGTAVGAYVLAGPDAGHLEYSIDGEDWQSVDLLHHFSSGLHYPRTVLFERDLPDRLHQVRVRVAEEQQDRGTAVRILNFVANGTDRL